MIVRLYRRAYIFCMENNRKQWNDRHKRLKLALSKPETAKTAIELFLTQHAMVHSARISKPVAYSFEDEIVKDLSVESWRMISSQSNHSIAWILWHLARIEDVTMNLLIADSQQVLHSNDWAAKLNIKEIHTGNGMTDNEILKFSDTIDIDSLRKYRLTVGRQTQKIVRKIKLDRFKAKVEPKLLQRIWNEKAMLPSGKGIIDYWGKRTIAGLLLMPPTRHNFLHLNEARRIKSANGDL